jgi:hypothetical protein
MTATSSSAIRSSGQQEGSRLFRVKEHAGLREIIVRDKYGKDVMLDDYAKGGKTAEDKEGKGNVGKAVARL